MQTVVETSFYLRRAEKLLSVGERADIITILAANPFAGDVMEGTGGVRKVRFATGGKGKSGGVRVIYYFHSELLPIYLFSVFAKNEKGNLSKAERNALKNVVESIKP